MKTRYGLLGEAEDRGDRVEREQQVRRPDREHDDQHRGHHAPAVDADERARAVVVVGDGQHAAKRAQGRVLRELGVVVLGALPGEVDGREDEHGGEQVEHPAERVDGRGADGDERTAHHQGDDDADQEHPVLVDGRDLERRHDDDEDEQVVDRQRVLGDVAGEELAGRHRPGEVPEAGTERDGEGDVDEHPAGGLPDGHGVGPAADDEQVEQDHGGQSADRDEPQPGGHGHGRSSEGTWARRGAGPRSLPSATADR